MFIVWSLPVAQTVIATDPLDPTLIARAQRFEGEAVASLCDRNLDRVYRMCLALAGEESAAEAFCRSALMKALDGLPGFDGDTAAFNVWLLRHAAGAAAKRRPRGDGWRQALSNLSNFDYELVALRVLGEVDTDHLAPALSAQPASVRAWLVSALREVEGRSGTGWGQDLRVFDEGVDDVIRGGDDQKAAERVSWPGDADSLLRTVAGLHGLLGDPIPPAVATRLRTDVLAAAAERRALWVHRHHAVATVPGIEQRRYSTRTGTVLALGTAAVLAVVVGSVLAMLVSFAGPESGLYPLKRTGEDALIAVNLDPVNRAQLEVKLAQTRQREAEDMAGRGDGDRAVEAVSTRYDLLRAAGRDLAGVTSHDSRWRAARDRLFKESDLQMTPLQRDLQAIGQGRSAQEVQQLVAGYDADRKSLETQLGRQSGPGSPGATPAPSPTG